MVGEGRYPIEIKEQSYRRAIANGRNAQSVCCSRRDTNRARFRGISPRRVRSPSTILSREPYIFSFVQIPPNSFPPTLRAHIIGETGYETQDLCCAYATSKG